MLLSLPGLAAAGYDGNAHGCRQFGQALGLLGQLRARKALPHMVAIALGANGTVTGDDINQGLRLLGHKRLLVLVTPRELGGGSGADAATERAAAAQHPRRILLLDWVRYSAGHPSWFAPDGLHLNLPGVKAFTALLSRALPYAYVPRPAQAAALASAALGGASRRPRSTPEPPVLQVRARLSDTGYVSATITGPPGADVALSERRGAATDPITTIRLSAAGTAAVSHALTWSCDRRTRTLIATTLAPAASATAQATVTTPSCATRLVTTIDARARAGHTLVVRLRDRWAIGGLALTVCVSPPGAQAVCTSWHLRPGQRRRVIQIPAPRPGGWLVSVHGDGGAPQQARIWVTPVGGRIRLLAAGDSEMQILDDFMGQDLSSYGVRVTSDARISTGLTNSSFFDWPAHARAQAPSLQPDVTVIFMGANDGFAVAGQHGERVACCGAAWSAGYANLVAEMMRTYLRRNAGRVYWFLLPTPRPANFQGVFDGVNTGIREAARRFPGRVSLIDANAFFTPGNRYRDYMRYHGHGFTIHEPDGIHLSTASDTVAASLLTQQLGADHVIR
ncbi:MAG: hypothetical protein ACR2NR_10860 [Solirubrobacteraceae bacterium]